MVYLILLYHVWLLSYLLVDITKSHFQQHTTSHGYNFIFDNIIIINVPVLWCLEHLTSCLSIIFASSWKKHRSTSDSACGWSTKLSAWTHDWCEHTAQHYHFSYSTTGEVQRKGSSFLTKVAVFETRFISHEHSDLQQWSMVVTIPLRYKPDGVVMFLLHGVLLCELLTQELMEWMSGDTTGSGRLLV